MNKKKASSYRWPWVKENFWNVLVVIIIWELFKLVIASIVLVAAR